MKHEAEAETAQVRIRLPHLAAVVAGNALEFYDFLTYAYFAIYIGRTFFPSHNATTSLLASLATFGAGFMTRPVGAIIIGGMGDRVGRRPAMVLTFALMGIAIIGLALTPSYDQIGVAAPILAIAFRLLQGFALGGEVGPTTAYLVEAAPPERRGLYSSMQSTTQDISVLSAGVVGVVLANMLNDQQLQAYGWRVAMLIGAIIVPWGLAMRRNLPESLHAADDAALAPDATSGRMTTRQHLKPYIALIIFGLMMLMAGTIGTYVKGYMTTYAIATLHMRANIAFGVTVVTAIVSVIMGPTSGILSDKFGRKRIMLIPAGLLLVSIIPCFWVIDHFRTTLALYGCMCYLSFLQTLAFVPVICTLTESLPRVVRAGAVATVYAFAISIFGGSTQFTIAWLIDFTNNPMAPAFYWTLALAIGMTAMALVKESAPVKVGVNPHDAYSFRRSTSLESLPVSAG